MVKVKVVEHSEDDISSEQESGSESAEAEMLNPFEDMAEDGEEEYDEEGEDLDDYDMEEMGEEELDAIAPGERDKRVNSILKELKKLEGNEEEGAEESQKEDDDVEEETKVEVDEEVGEDDKSNASLDTLERYNA